MIVPMVKVYVAARCRDRERLLEAIRELGVIHLVPADPAQALADGPTAEAIQALQRAHQVLYGIKPLGNRVDLPAVEVAREVLNVERHTVENSNRLALLHHELDQLELWGNVRLQQIEGLRQAGVEVGFYAVADHDVASVRADCVAVVGELSDGRTVVAVAVRGGSLELPDGAAALPLPPRDAPSIREEAAQIDAALKAGHRRLARLAHLVPELLAESARLEQQAEFIRAQRGGVASDQLFAVQGWLPAEQAPLLPEALARTNLPAAVHWREPAEDEQPPTLIRSPAWARPIEGLFNILGTVAGYREFDVSVPFLIALPIFTAILISDGGYGAVLLLGLTFGYRRAASILGKHFTQLLIIISVATLLWGGVCATFFGVTLYPPLIAIDLSESSRTFMMRMCFWMGAIHLSIAQLWPAVGLFPDLRFLNRVGWAAFIWGMLGVVQMFVLKTPLGWDTPWPYLLLAGAALAIVFAEPSRNVGKMLLLGLANFPLSMLSAFSDVISYVRLMAVSLAGSVLGGSFNDMAFGIDFWPLTVLVLVGGHSLNLGLAMIAMFAHGVRLNMLEFCNNLGMKWTGYPVHPLFSTKDTGGFTMMADAANSGWLMISLPALLAASETLWRFLGQFGGVTALGLGALGSALGIGAAGQAAAGAWAKEARAGRRLSFTYIILVGAPISQTLYAMIVMNNMSAINANPERSVSEAGLLLAIGLATGLGEMFSAWMQGLIGAAGIRALSDSEGQGFAFILIALGIVETVGIFTMVFLLGMIPIRLIVVLGKRR